MFVCNLRSFLPSLRNTALGAVLMTMSAATGANLIIDGDFASGTLDAWTTFTTDNGTIGTPLVRPFETIEGVASNAASFNVGRLPNTEGEGGGGIFQEFTFGGGTLTASMDVASFLDAGPGTANTNAGIFSLLLNGIVVDSIDFGRIEGGEILRSHLQFTGALDVGESELRVLITRPFVQPSGLRQYVDNIAVFQESDVPVPVPAPGTLALLGIGLAGLALTRRRKR